MAPVAFLPKLFGWVFAALEVFCAFTAIVVAAAYLIDPRLPTGTQFGPFEVDFAGQPGTIALQPVDSDSNFTLTALRGNIVLSVEKAGGLIEVAKHYGLPTILISMIFLVVLFDLMRRLFRNVNRRDTFTRQSIVLVQLVGVSLIVYAVMFAFAEGWFANALLTYLSQNATVTVSGTPLHLPPPDGMSFRFPFTTAFFTGLLVLALSEVFRQGLALKSEHDLTV